MFLLGCFGKVLSPASLPCKIAYILCYFWVSSFLPAKYQIRMAVILILESSVRDCNLLQTVIVSRRVFVIIGPYRCYSVAPCSEDS